MGQVIKGFIDVIKALNLADKRTLNRTVLCQNLLITDEELNLILTFLGQFGDLITLNGQDVTLNDHLDLLDQDYIYKNTQTPGRVEVLESIDSTNTYMLDNAKNLANGDTVIAELQVNGRGRRGDKWHSSLGKQLTLSVNYNFDNFEQLRGLSVGIGVAVAQTIEKFGFEDIQLKWPNDIYKDHKKVGGILIETVTSANKIQAIIGIGLNVFPDTFGSLNRDYTSIFEKFTSNHNRNSVAIELINKVKTVCASFKELNKQTYIDSFVARDELLGKYILIKNEQGEFKGRACGIDDNGALLLLDATDQNIKPILSGHITFL